MKVMGSIKPVGLPKHWLLIVICVSSVLMTGLFWSEELHAHFQIVMAGTATTDHGVLPLYSSTRFLPVTSIVPKCNSKYDVDHSNRQEVAATVPQSEMHNRKSVTKTILYTRGFTNLGNTFNSPVANNFEKYSPQHCDGYKCAIKTTKSLSVSGADIVVFFGIGISGHPLNMPPGQLWTFQTGESQISLAASQPQM